MSSWQFDQVWKFEASLASATPGVAYAMLLPSLPPSLPAGMPACRPTARSGQGCTQARTLGQSTAYMAVYSDFRLVPKVTVMEWPTWLPYSPSKVE